MEVSVTNTSFFLKIYLCCQVGIHYDKYTFTCSVRRVRISRDKSQSKEEPLLSTVEDPPDNEENDVDPGLLNPGL